MVTEALLVPAAVGLKVTLIMQLAPIAKLEPHVLVCEKSPKFAPATAMPVNVSVLFPLLLSVTVCMLLAVPTSWLPNVSCVGDRPTEGPVPVPERATPCGLPVALSVIVTDAFLAPRAAGVNVTLIVQLAPAAKLVPQLFV